MLVQCYMHIVIQLLSDDRTQLYRVSIKELLLRAERFL